MKSQTSSTISVPPLVSGSSTSIITAETSMLACKKCNAVKWATVFLLQKQPTAVILRSKWTTRWASGDNVSSCLHEYSRLGISFPFFGTFLKSWCWVEVNMENKKQGQASPIYPILPPASWIWQTTRGDYRVSRYICFLTGSKSSQKANPFELDLIMPPGEQGDGGEHQPVCIVNGRSLRIKLIRPRYKVPQWERL